MGMRVVVRPDGSRVAEECDCRQGLKIAKRYARCGIPPKYEKATLDQYQTGLSSKNGSLWEAHNIATQFSKNYPAMMAPGRGIMFVGPPGVGKTHLAVGILKVLTLEASCEGLFVYYQQLLKDIQNSWNPQTATTELQVLEPVFNVEVLVLDDLGSVKPTDWVWDTVAMVLNTRYNQKRTTIITTNFDNLPAGGAGAAFTLGDRIGDRMRSRLLEMCREVKMLGQDYRERFADQEAGLSQTGSARR
jgi:DNA replication protein DnaC